MPVDQATRTTKRAWVALALVFISLALSAGAFYYFFHPRIEVQTTEKIITAPYEFAWKGDRPPTQHVFDKHFSNEKVVLDDISYVRCTFQNVTFVYNGTAPFFVQDSQVNGYKLSSDNPSISAVGYLLYGLGVLKIPFIDSNTGKPPANIEPAFEVKIGKDGKVGRIGTEEKH
jgi:hypothetical protein